MMPTPTLFITFSFLLRMVEGIGSAMFFTASYTLVIQLYQEKRGTVVVSMPDLFCYDYLTATKY